LFWTSVLFKKNKIQSHCFYLVKARIKRKKKMVVFLDPKTELYCDTLQFQHLRFFLAKELFAVFNELS